MSWKRPSYVCQGLACLMSFCLWPAAHGLQFHDVTKETGISFVHTDGSSGKRYIVETVTAGVGLFDYDSDGDMDIYFLNGAPLKGTQAKRVSRNALYRNEGDWRFTDVTKRAGVGDTGYGLGLAIGDYDNDGDRDIYVNNFGPNVLYRNNGDGTFADVTQSAGVANGNQVGAGASFLDIDRDGDLDLYVANYVDFTYDTHQTCRFNGYPAYVGPMNFNGTPNTLYRNNGDSTFTDVSEASGIAAHPGTGMG
ncbi:MAG: VCBS repeat-containing protein, partial [Planctomycetes bacterium]|nr:VCBS repeat-containing protein [Planctomycetota bacterium]